MNDSKILDAQNVPEKEGERGKGIGERGKGIGERRMGRGERGKGIGERGKVFS